MEISNSLFIMNAVHAGAAFLIPGILTYYLHRRFPRASLKSFWIGCLIFVVASGILESLFHQIILRATPAGGLILNNVWLYALYGGAAAALFEEGGRYFAFKKLLVPQREENGNALLYGAGHGGVECFALLAMNAASNISYGLLLKSGGPAAITEGITDPDLLAEAEQLITALTSAGIAEYSLGIVERLIAVGIHLGLSVLMWFGVKNGPQGRWLIFAAVALHFFVDFLAVLLSTFIHPLAMEGVVLLIAVGIDLLARRSWLKYSK